MVPLHQSREGVLTHIDLAMVMSWAHVRWDFEEGHTRQMVCAGGDIGQRVECLVLSLWVRVYGVHEGNVNGNSC